MNMGVGAGVTNLGRVSIGCGRGGDAGGSEGTGRGGGGGSSRDGVQRVGN